MRKFFNWLIIIICSILLLSIGVTLIMTLLPELLPRTVDTETSLSDIISILPGFLIVIAITSLGLTRAIKRLKKKKSINISDYTKTLNINVSGSVSYKDYRNLMLGIIFKKPTYLFYLVIFILLFFSTINGNESFSDIIANNLFIYFLIGIFCILPILTLIQIKKNYQTNKFLHESITYSLTNESVHLQANSFETTQNWTNFIKTQETKSFFVLYQSNNAINILDKKMFTKEEIREIQSFIVSLGL